MKRTMQEFVLNMKNPNTIVAGHLQLKGRFESACRVFDTNGVAPTQNTCMGGGLETYIIEYDDED